MIARAPYLFLLLVILPDLYFDQHYWKHRHSVAGRLLRWLPTIAMVAYTLYLAYEPNFLSDPPSITYIYLFLLSLISIPKMAYMLCSVTGLACTKLFHRKDSSHKSRNWGNLLGWFLVMLIWYVSIYGAFIGFGKLEVNRQTYRSAAVPKAFDGYKIVLFSDAHVGSYAGSGQKILQRAIDSINAQKPDMIVFTGDLQNTHPQEIYEHMDILSSLKARDGVYAVLGNHDYAKYIAVSDAQKVANERETVSLEKQLGWHLLQNAHSVIERDNARYGGKGKSYLVVAGMENDGDGVHFPQNGDIKQTLNGVQMSDDAFLLMLEHDPSAWRRKIIPDGRAQLTLSGHTHNTQFALFGWSPLALTGKEVNGWYHEGQQSLFVTAGLGGLIPFRFGATGEIVVLTLHREE